jgi:hypothetical protein
MAPAQPVQPAQQPANQARPNRYRVTVRVLRPVVKRLPTVEQMNQDVRWIALADLQEAGSFQNDAALLRRLRRVWSSRINPQT